MYTEVDYYYDGTLCAVICPECITRYKFDNAEYTDTENIDAHKHWEGASLICECCNGEIKSEYGEVDD